MSLFADKWTSPFVNNNPFGQDDFHSTSFGQFCLESNFPLFRKTFDEEEDRLSLKMKLRNGSVVTERGFYDHFDSIFHDRSRRYDLRAAAAASDSSRRRAPQSTTGSGKEYIIPIKIETSPKGKTRTSKTAGAESISLTASNSSTSTSNSTGRVLEIPITRECSGQNGKTKRDKSRSPILPQSSKISPSFKVLTPTTEEERSSPKRDSSIDVELDSDIFFVRSESGPQRKAQATKPESDIQVVEIEDVHASKPETDIQVLEIEVGDSFRKSLCRKPLRHFHNTPSVSSQETVVAKRLSHLAADKTQGAKPVKDDADCMIQDVRRQGFEKKSESKGSPCGHPGPVDVAAPPSYPIYDYLKPKLAAQDRRVDYTRGDGNCFFRAISKDVYGSEEYHAECRQAVCDLIHSHPDLFRQFIDHSTVTAHVTEMRVQSTWATTCEIYAAATLLERDIYVLAPSPSSDTEYHWLLFSPRPLAGSATGGSSAGRRRQGANGDRHPCYMTLCHTNANHYDHIIPISAHCNCQLPPPSLNGVSMMLDLTTTEQEEFLRRSEV